MEVTEIRSDTYIAVWADGTWAHLEDLSEYTFMSDDYTVLPLEVDAEGNTIEPEY